MTNSVTLLPNGRQQFINANGVPFVGGTVTFYIPATTTPKNTWSDSAGTILNTNPIVLDALGSAAIWGTGSYRQILKDVSGNLIWDVVTLAPQLGAGTGELFITTLATAEAATIAGGTPSLTLLGYYSAGDGGGAQYIPASAGAGSGKFQSADGQWWILAEPAPNVRMFGCYLDGSHDDTAAFQAALNWGGYMFVPTGTLNYTAATITKPLRLSGEAQGTTTGTSVLACTAATSTDKIIVGGSGTQLSSVTLEHLSLTAASATGGNSGTGSIVFFSNCGDSSVRDCQFYTLNQASVAIKSLQVNGFKIRDVRCVEPYRAGYYAYGGDTTRTDDVSIIDLIVSGNATSGATILPNGVEIDGFVNTVTGIHWNFVQCGRGLYAHNAVGTTERAEYIEVFDLESDFHYYEGIRIDYHDGCHFHDTYVNGSITTHNIVVSNLSSPTVTNIEFIGGECIGAFQNGMYLDGRYTRVSNMLVTANSVETSGTYPGIEIGPDSIAVSVQGNQIGSESGVVAATHSYGVQIDSGAAQWIVANNDLTGNVVAALQNLSLQNQDSSAFLGSNIGYGTLPNSAQAAVAPTTGFSIQIGPGGGDYNVEALELLPAGTLAAGTILLPAIPRDGQPLNIYSSQIITALTVTPGSGQTIDAAPTAMTAGGSFAIQFQQSGSTTGNGRWLRLR